MVPPPEDRSTDPLKGNEACVVAEGQAGAGGGPHILAVVASTTGGPDVAAMVWDRIETKRR